MSPSLIVPSLISDSGLLPRVMVPVSFSPSCLSLRVTSVVCPFRPAADHFHVPVASSFLSSIRASADMLSVVTAIITKPRQQFRRLNMWTSKEMKRNDDRCARGDDESRLVIPRDWQYCCAHYELSSDCFFFFYA